MKIITKKSPLKGMSPPKPVQPVAQEVQEEVQEEVIEEALEDEGTEASDSINVDIQQPMAVIDKTYPDGTSTQEMVPVGEPGQVPSPHATVSVSMGMTVPLSEKYANIKFQVFLACPCEVNQESIDGTYEEVKGWVDSKVEEIHSEITAQLG